MQYASQPVVVCEEGVAVSQPARQDSEELVYSFMRVAGGLECASCIEHVQVRQNLQVLVFSHSVVGADLQVGDSACLATSSIS